MYLGIINGWEEGHFKAVSEKGLQGIEFCINDKYESAEVLAKANEIKSYSEKYNVKVGSIGRWGMERINENGEIIESAFQHDKNLIDLASIVGCPVYNVGFNRIEKLSYYENCQKAIEYFKTLIDYARPKNVKIATYNCDWSNFVYNEKAWSVIHGALPELGIKYDPSHCYRRHGDYLKEIRDWGDRILHFHVKGTMDIAGEGYDDCPAGLDCLNWKGIMVVLYNTGYDNMLSIEPHSRNWHGGRGQWGVDYTIRFMRDLIMPEEYKNIENDPYMP